MLVYYSKEQGNKHSAPNEIISNIIHSDTYGQPQCARVLREWKSVPFDRSNSTESSKVVIMLLGDWQQLRLKASGSQQEQNIQSGLFTWLALVLAVIWWTSKGVSVIFQWLGHLTIWQLFSKNESQEQALQQTGSEALLMPGLEILHHHFVYIFVS